MKAKRSAETVVTGHANADFDCFAAIVAAGKLYPGAALVFPGSQEKNLRNFFIESATYLFNFVDMKDLDPAAVKLLVVVDTRQRSRLAHVEELLRRGDIEIHTYDHHPDSSEDLKATLAVWEPWGSCTAILIDRIRSRGIEVTPEEATVMGLGIYEDTGSFIFASTTEHDLAAAAWLRGRGMDLDVISDLTARELTATQLGILNSLVESATVHDINGIEVVIAEVTSEHYVGDFAVLAHKLMDMQNIRVLFAIGCMADRVQLVARSREPKVDVRTICEHFGGGGHSYAASASIKDRTPAQVKDELFALLFSHVSVKRLVREFMSSPPVAVDTRETIAKAAELMTRYGLKAVPVLSKGRDVEAGHEGLACCGLLEHQVADKAVAHGLGEVEVREYMQHDVRLLSPDDDLMRAMEVVLHGRQRLAPVVEDGRLLGVVTRTDLINLLVEEPARIPESLFPDKRRERGIKHLIEERLPARFQEILRAAGRLGLKLGVEVYAVGGFVRDMLLGVSNLDLDLVVEGDGVAFAGQLANELSGRMKSHPKFKTAVVVLQDDVRVDVATARLEYYEYPAALPIVELSSIKMDLYRRDFTINALAVHLNPGRFGQLVDFFGGQRDIKDKVVRVLHSLSFVEDPTRILRAIRFEQRYGFRIGGQTERLIKNAVKLHFFQKLSGSRIFHELTLIFEERHGLKCLERMEGFKLLPLVHPSLELTPKRITLIEDLEEVLNWFRLLYLPERIEAWKLYFLGLTSGLSGDAVDELLTRLSVGPRDKAQFLELREHMGLALGNVLRWRSEGGPLSELTFILRELPLEGVLYLMAGASGEDTRKNLSLYVTRLRTLRLDINGRDLKLLGLSPGPLYGNILRAVLAAKIDGHADCRADQLALAKHLAAGIPRMDNTQAG